MCAATLESYDATVLFRDCINLVLRHFLVSKLHLLLRGDVTGAATLLSFQNYYLNS